MTLRIIVCCLVASGLAGAVPFEWNPGLRAKESENIASWKSVLSDAEKTEGVEKLRLLSPGLREMADWTQWDGRNPDVDVLYQDTRTIMRDVPGYASLIVGDIEKRKAEIRSKGANAPELAVLPEAAGTIFRTLQSLRSPESVAAVAGYLSDETDVPNPNPGRDTRPPLAVSAYWSLYAMRIKGYPNAAYQDHYIGSPSDPKGFSNKPIENAKAWWNEVKAGRRPISFAGEEVQYHFNPDGSVRTSPYKPVDYPPISAAMTLPEVFSLRYLRWIGGGVALIVLLLAGWFYKRRAA